MVDNNVYGVYRKSNVPFKNKEEVSSELKSQIVMELEQMSLNSNEYSYETIDKQFEEMGMPVWSLAVKASKKVVIQ